LRQEVSIVEIGGACARILSCRNTDFKFSVQVSMQQLQTKYERAIASWRLLRTDHSALSAPLLVVPPVGYSTASVRLMIIGQETLGWGEEIDSGQSAPELVEALKHEYRSFDLGSKYRSTPFWNAADCLYDLLNPGGASRAFVWTNLVKMDCERRRPTSVLEDSIAAMNLVEAEIVAFAPNVVVFFTGPRYDDRLLRTFPGARLESRSRTVSTLVHPDLPVRMFRTYHPKYLRMSRQWSTLNDIVSYCVA
jgi:hypothetical protein